MTECRIGCARQSFEQRHGRAAASLLPGLIHLLRHNIGRKNYDVALFEIGRVFTSAERPNKEERRVAMALTGQRALPFWAGDEREAKFDVYD